MRGLARAGIVTMLMLLGLSACAVGHDEIMPLPIDPAAYEGATCRQMGLMLDKAQRTLVYTEMAQDHIAAEDDIRAFGVPTLMGTIFEGSRAYDVARLKGETIALKTQLQQSGCVAWPG